MAYPYLTFGRYMRQRFGERVHKISLHAGMTCPNRDGSKGIGGCTFCNNATFSPNSRVELDIVGQIAKDKQRLTRRFRARKFLAYFQSYTNTYADVETLRRLYDMTLSDPDVIGMSVGTRPDCVPDEVLALLAGYQAQGHEIWLELGLQSTFDDSLARVNRGHGFAEYEDAVERARKFGLKLCTHLIVGLPGEAPEDTLISFDRVMALGTDSIKIHPLHVVRGTQLAREWKRGDYQPIGFDDYVRVVSEIILRAPDDLIFQRLTGTAGRDLLLAPMWCEHKWPVMNAVEARLKSITEEGSWNSSVRRAVTPL
ncbi:MAG: TIGR01212 family radical SAM protein [Gammaproteobacteria bacterium]|nr:MAG: TIGR01212 family radical SAM protein [Gammaproteobacteria bacterium]